MRDMSEAAGGQRGLSRRLADQIVEHARRERLAPGAHLAEQNLAEAFGVSRTPVRLALQVLEAEGVVERRRHRGVFLRRLPEGARPAEAAPPGDDPVYFRIADDYLSGTIGPRVAESDMLRRYGLPRARLHRLFARMVREGWLERRPGHGWMFLPILRSPQAYAQSYRFRRLIEPAALLEPGYRLEPAVIARLRGEQRALLDGGWQTFSRAETHRIGAQFHEAIVAGSGNPFLIEALRRVNAMRRVVEYRIHRERDWLVKVCREHLRLLDLIEAGKLDTAAAFLRDHLQDARDTKGPLAEASMGTGRAAKA